MLGWAREKVKPIRRQVVSNARLAVSVRGSLFQYPLQHAQLAVDRTNLQPENLRDQEIYIDALEL